MIKNDKRIKILKTLKHLLIITLIAFGLFPPPASAAEVKVPVDLQAKLFLTALTYDKNLKERADNQLKIRIVYFPEVSQSKEEALHFSRVLEGFKDKKVSGLSIDSFLLAYNNNDDLKNKISFEKINVLYLAPGIKKDIKGITKVTQSEKVLSFTSVAEYVTKCGISMAIGLKANRPKIYLNLSSARAEGADFSAKFLRVVEIVGKYDHE